MSSPGPDPSIVLVHGADADGSPWSAVIQRLQGAGLAVTAVQNPLTSLADDVAHARRIVALHETPVILAGHSFAGTVISEAVDRPAQCGPGLHRRSRRGGGPGGNTPEPADMSAMGDTCT